MTEPTASPATTPAATSATARPRRPTVTDQPVADIASVQGLDFPPKPSPTQAAEKILRDRLAHVLEVVINDRSAGGMRRMGAALFVAHMATDLPKGATKATIIGAPLGLEAASKLSADEVFKYSAAFRARYPGAWGAAAASNVQGLVRHLRIAGLRGLSGDETIEQMIVGLQSLMSKLSVE